MFYESDVCYQTKLVKDAFFEAVAKNGSRIRFPRIVFREKIRRVYTRVFASTDIFSLLSSSLSLRPSTEANTAIPTNCKSCASKRTKRHEESRQRTYFTFIRSLGRLNHSWPRVELSIPCRLRKPTWPLVFLPIFPFETWSRPVSPPFSFVGRWILIIVRPIPLPSPHYLDSTNVVRTNEQRTTNTGGKRIFFM